MNRTPVDSSHVAAIGYDPETRKLEVGYKDGSVYHYHNVSPERHAALMSSNSIGKHLHHHIKLNHRTTKL